MPPAPSPTLRPWSKTSGRAGPAKHARSFLSDWQGKLVCDDFAGYKASFEQGVTEIGCMAHARRKFFDLHAANQSQLAEQALQYIGQLYGVEREGRELLAEQRQQLRQDKTRPTIYGLHSWSRRCRRQRDR